MQSEQVNELATALAKAQASMKNAVLNKVNPHFRSKYADLASVLDAVREPLGTNGLSIAQQTVITEGHLLLRTTLMHSSGQFIASEFPLPTTAKPQEMGSALTYARRYTLTALICNAADEDDDANAAEGERQQIKTPPKPKPVEIAKPSAAALIAGATPHPIPFEDPLKPDWIQWGSAFIAYVEAAAALAEVEQWESVNATTLTAMEEAAPKVHSRLKTAVNKRKASLYPPQQEAAE